MAPEGSERASQAPSLTSLPRVEDLPSAADGYDREKVRESFEAYRRHTTQLQVQLRVLQAAGQSGAEPTGHAVRMDAMHMIRAAAEMADTIERDAQTASAAQLRRTEEEVSRRQRELPGLLIKRFGQSRRRNALSDQRQRHTGTKAQLRCIGKQHHANGSDRSRQRYSRDQYDRRSIRVCWRRGLPSSTHSRCRLDDHYVRQHRISIDRCCRQADDHDLRSSAAEVVRELLRDQTSERGRAAGRSKKRKPPPVKPSQHRALGDAITGNW